MVPTGYLFDSLGFFLSYVKMQLNVIPNLEGCSLQERGCILEEPRDTENIIIKTEYDDRVDNNFS